MSAVRSSPSRKWRNLRLGIVGATLCMFYVSTLTIIGLVGITTSASAKVQAVTDSTADWIKAHTPASTTVLPLGQRHGLVSGRRQASVRQPRVPVFRWSRPDTGLLQRRPPSSSAWISSAAAGDRPKARQTSPCSSRQPSLPSHPTMTPWRRFGATFGPTIAWRRRSGVGRLRRRLRLRAVELNAGVGSRQVDTQRGRGPGPWMAGGAVYTLRNLPAARDVGDPHVFVEWLEGRATGWRPKS